MPVTSDEDKFKSLCRLAQCPYYNSVCNDPHGYGCTRFGSVNHCPGAQKFGLGAGQSEYELFGEIDVQAFKNYTEGWLQRDRKYSSDLEFQDELGFDELPFPNRRISGD